ncbi:uncharacterized protein LOC101238518 isoform X4 [Hydra vulgaris]|uniref:Uncharacterized protein LOC101238518 isoform X4 n=1 Tax=Hydra vulgaris TaxID=6087 RepID=A0ABM4BEV2_HYDVU
MSTLEFVIKDLEFENEKIIIQTQEEIAILEDMQNNLRNKSAENEKLEEEIDKYNSDIKVLHSQFKQNQEITERYLGDLRNNLKLKCQETDNEREKLEKISENYRSKWLHYEEEYEKCALAKEIRDFKLKVAKLDAEEAELNEMHQKMEIKIQQYENKKGFSRRQKEEAITSIIHLAQLHRIIMNLNIQIPTMIDEKTALSLKINDLENKKEVYKAKNTEDVKNKAFLKDKIPDEKPILQQLNVVNDGIKNSQFPHDQSTFVPKLPQQVVKADILQSSSLHITRIGNSKIRLPNFIVAQQSQMTNRDSNQTSSNYLKMPQLPKFPSFHKYSMNKLSSYKLEKSQVVKDIPPPVEPEKEAASYLQSLQLQNCYIQEKERAVVKESITRLPIGNFIAPLDQTTDEFFGLERRNNVESDEITQSSSPLSKFSFSPNQHAENLKKLKQSPGDAFFRTGRPMFNHNPYQLNQKCTDINEESIKNQKSNPASSFNYSELLSESGSVVNVVSHESFPTSKSENFSMDRFSLASPGIHFNTSSDHSAFTFSSATNFTQNNQAFQEPTFSFGVLENTKDAKSPAFSFDANQQSYDQNPVQFGSFPSAELGCNVFNFGNESTESVSDSPFNFSVAPNDEKAPSKERFDFKFGGVSSQVKSSSFSFNF